MKFIRRFFILAFAALAGCFYYYKFQAITTVARNINAGSSYSSDLGNSGGGIGRIGGVGPIGNTSAGKSKYPTD